MKSIIFWDMTLCSLLSCNWRFGGTYRLHLQGWRNNFSKNQQVSRWQACHLTDYTVSYPGRWYSLSHNLFTDKYKDIKDFPRRVPFFPSVPYNINLVQRGFTERAAFQDRVSWDGRRFTLHNLVINLFTKFPPISSHNYKFHTKTQKLQNTK
jgi:hypothetical protein